MSDPHEVKTARAKFGIAVCKVLLVVLPALGVGSFAAANHSQSSKGYELLATMVNQHEQRLDAIEKVLLRIETQVKVSASQPAVSLTGPIIIPGGRVDPYDRIKPALKAPVTKAPVAKVAPVAKAPLTKVAPAKAPSPIKTEKVTILVNPKYVAPASAPAPTIKRSPMRQAPKKLRDVP